MATRATTSKVAADLHAHEVKCEERWKTIFNETNVINQEISSINKTMRLSAFGVFGFTGTLIIALLSLILPIQ